MINPSSVPRPDQPESRAAPDHVETLRKPARPVSRGRRIGETARERGAHTVAELEQLEGTARNRRSARSPPAARVERDEERPLEDGAAGNRPLDAGRLERPHLPHHRGALRQGREAKARHRAGSARQFTGHAPPWIGRHLRRAGHGEDPLGALRGSTPAARRRPLHRQPGVGVARHGRRARLRVLRVAGALLSRSRREAALEEEPRQDVDEARARRGQLAGATRRHDRRQLGSRSAVVRRRVRQDERRGALEGAAR